MPTATLDPTAFWRSPGVWIAVAGALFMVVNAIRSWRSPVAFAAYLGLPLADARDASMVRIYALRALFIALSLTALLWLRDAGALAIVALAACVMPIGDAVLTSRAAAPAATVARHVIIALALAAAGLLLLCLSPGHG
jgi:hypothetical protein